MLSSEINILLRKHDSLCITAEKIKGVGQMGLSTPGTGAVVVLVDSTVSAGVVGDLKKWNPLEGS